MNPLVKMALGIFGSVSSLFLARSSSPLIHLLPWSYPALSSPLIPGHMQWVGISLGAGLILLLLGTLLFSRREFE